MSTQTLSHVTLETLENYRAAATQAVVAYRLGGHRLVGAINGALEARVYPRTAKVSARATDRLNEVCGNVSESESVAIERCASSNCGPSSSRSTPPQATTSAASAAMPMAI